MMLLLTLAVARADDIADAKAAFATMIEYQKSDDVRTLDLFAQDCAVTFTFTDGKATRVVALPTAAFRQMLQKSLDAKQGNQDVYEDVKYTQEGPSVRVDSTIVYHDTGKREPFSVLYVRDNGAFKIKR